MRLHNSQPNLGHITKPQKVHFIDLDTLPDNQLLAVSDIVRTPNKGKRHQLPILPISRATWYRGVASGQFPEPVKVGTLNYWRAGDIKKVVKHYQGEQG